MWKTKKKQARGQTFITLVELTTWQIEHGPTTLLFRTPQVGMAMMDPHPPPAGPPPPPPPPPLGLLLAPAEALLLDPLAARFLTPPKLLLPKFPDALFLNVPFFLYPDLAAGALAAALDTGAAPPPSCVYRLLNSATSAFGAWLK